MKRLVALTAEAEELTAILDNSHKGEAEGAKARTIAICSSSFRLHPFVTLAGRRHPSCLSSLPVQLRAGESAPESQRAPVLLPWVLQG